MSLPSLTALLAQIRQQPKQVEFATVQAVILSHYHYQPMAFRNGIGKDELTNAAGNNEGSCRIFAFGLLHGLSEAQTLACFGHIYREQVLSNPGGADHANIRTFLRHGWPGIRFSGKPLTENDNATLTGNR